MTWNSEWHKVIFSDEKKWNLDGPDDFPCYWHDLRKESLYYCKQRAGGGSVMIWACFGWNYKSSLAFIDCRIDSQNYCQLLSNHVENISRSFGDD